MEISRDALMRVVKAARMATKQAEVMQMLMMEKKVWTTADEIASFLQDAIFILSGEELATGQPFDSSNTMRLLTGDMDDDGVTDWLLMMDNIRRKHLPQGEVKQPAPQTMSKVEMKDLYRKFGGYQSPEGEWK